MFTAAIFGIPVWVILLIIAIIAIFLGGNAYQSATAKIYLRRLGKAVRNGKITAAQAQSSVKGLIGAVPGELKKLLPLLDAEIAKLDAQIAALEKKIEAETDDDALAELQDQQNKAQDARDGFELIKKAVKERLKELGG